jgi:hypothetical protein
MTFDFSMRATALGLIRSSALIGGVVIIRSCLRRQCRRRPGDGIPNETINTIANNRQHDERKTENKKAYDYRHPPGKIEEKIKSFAHASERRLTKSAAAPGQKRQGTNVPALRRRLPRQVREIQAHQHSSGGSSHAQCIFSSVLSPSENEEALCSISRSGRIMQKPNGGGPEPT